ncbi:hypothetical protein MMC28_007133 [Mycoblastus sanguinarius]|nr:hypothetical protein [Mycoblastus sanguinarius]
MLHELLLGLSHGPSPLRYAPNDTASEIQEPLQSFLSPAEQVLLKSLAQDLGEKNKNIRDNAAIISSCFPSTVCRAVSTTLTSTHLAKFQRKILEVERDILEEDPSIVGAYKIVPLSAIVGAFDGWGRKLEWMWDLIQFIKAPKSTGLIRLERTSHGSCTAPELMEYLRRSTHTGYPDIEQISLDLVQSAETAWLKQISAWVLYGRYPANGAADFFVTREKVNGNQAGSTNIYGINSSLVPHFVTASTANSILFIGKSLNHIRDRQSSSTDGFSTAYAPELTLLPSHLSRLSSLKSPLSSSSFSAAIRAIRFSLSQNALQKLLPMSKVLGMLRMLKDFFLLERGEFAVALITAADERLTSKKNPAADRPKQEMIENLASMTIKEGEVSTVLARTWTSLASLQSVDDEDGDAELDQAREVIRLSIKSVTSNSRASRDAKIKPSMASFDDILLPSPTILTIRVPSPLDLFLATCDIDAYSEIHAYLLAIRRAHLRLSKLYLLSVLRRDHPSPNILGKHNGFDTVSQMRQRSSRRTKFMRPIWATIGSAAFFLAEIGEYFQGEVVKASWSTFHSWLVSPLTSDPLSANASLMSSVNPSERPFSSRPTSSRLVDQPQSQSFHDPESLSQAHRRYLASLETSLLLDDPEFINPLRHFMTSVDHVAALMHRLSNTQQSLDVELGTETTGSFASQYLAEEKSLLNDLSTAQLNVASNIQASIEALRKIDSSRTLGRSIHTVKSSVEDDDGFVPWQSGGVDRLLLKFDYRNVPLAPPQIDDG